MRLVSRDCPWTASEIIEPGCPPTLRRTTPRLWPPRRRHHRHTPPRRLSQEMPPFRRASSIHHRRHSEMFSYQAQVQSLETVHSIGNSKRHTIFHRRACQPPSHLFRCTRGRRPAPTQTLMTLLPQPPSLFHQRKVRTRRSGDRETKQMTQLLSAHTT